ncbi:hypothetical protein R1sor_005164 [Riccia sorocarpa]|uniref:Short-chain dehydrogenase/reductase n=1 Tax=Riccia sorocarpa TaxID=122646 RepID=A0ABD3HJD6_9MARC
MASVSAVRKIGAPRLEGKVAVITGGASGIGEATVRLFTAEGAKVIIADIRDADGENLAREVGGTDVARFIHCDVRKEDNIAAAVDLAVSAFGTLDIMYNNAGIIGPRYAIDETPAEELDQIYSINFRGMFLGIKHAARIMKPLQKGSIINAASVTAHTAGLGPHAYTALKHGIIGLTRTAAFELRHYQVRVNAVSPGGVITNIWDTVPDGRKMIGAFATEKPDLRSPVTSADNIAKAVLFLASDDAAYVSGESILVDGSHTVAPTTPARAIVLPWKDDV